MKLFTFLAIFIITSFLGFDSKAQEIGIRVGNERGGLISVDATYPADIGASMSAERIHPDVYYGENTLGIDLPWDFIFRPLFSNSPIDIYTGAGPFFALSNDFAVGLLAEIGIEYRYEYLPIAFGLDYRPAIELMDEAELDAAGFGFNVRYVF